MNNGELKSNVPEMEVILAAMTQAVVHYNHNRAAIRANPAARDLFGFDPTGMDWYDLVEITSLRNPDGSPISREELPFERALNGEALTGQYYLMVSPQGEERLVRASFSPLVYQEVVSGVIAVWQDVSEREKLIEQLEIEQSRLETIIKNAPEGIIVADEEGTLVQGNPAAEYLLGRALPIGKGYEHLSELNICYENGAQYDPRYLPLICSALDGERMNNVELLVALPGSQFRWLLSSTAPIIDRKGNLNGAVGILQDITGRKLSEKELQNQANRSRLLDSLSHAFAEAGLDYQELIETIVMQIDKTLGDCCRLEVYPDGGELPQTETAEGCGTEENARSSSKLRVPLRAHGRNIGILEIIRTQPGNSFSADDHAFFHDLADRAALAIDDAQLYEREMRRVRELDALNQAMKALLSTIDLETLLAQILNAAQKAIPAAAQGILYLHQENTHRLEIRATIGAPDPSQYSQAIERHAAKAVSERRPLLINHMEAGVDSHLNAVQSAILAPLMLNKKILGALVLSSSSPNLFNPSDLHLLDSFAATATAALKNATLYQEVERLATIDAVTGQYNRHKLIELSELEIQRFHRLKIPLAAIMFDMDDFKHINDTFGHTTGDQVLQAVAQRCRASIRGIDILGRYGGDEFAILLPYANLEEAEDIARRIRQAIIADPLHIQDLDIPVTISLGVTQAIPKTRNYSDLLERADAALYRSKQNGKNCISVVE